MTYVPTPFPTPVVSPSAITAYGSTSYISVSEYRNAPTSVGTNNLVPGSTNPQADSTAALHDVIQRASIWMDDHCFHRDGSFVAQPITEQMWATVKPTGEVVVLSNFKPIRQVLGFAVGPAASQLMDIGPGAAADITMTNSTITLPGYWSGIRPMFGGYPTNNGKLLCVYTYISGYPHAALANACSAGDLSITVMSPSPNDPTLWAAYAGTALTIRDGAQTERIILASTPSGLTLSLASGLKYSHTPPPSPDAIMVSALPWSVEEACVLMTNVFVKTQGNRAFVLPPGETRPSATTRKALGRAGAMGDYELACHLLHTYVVSVIHG